MLFIIFIIGGLLGIIATLWLSKPQVVASEERWYAVSHEDVESLFFERMRRILRAGMKVVLIWMIHWYRTLSQKITLKQQLKQRVRKFLYEHHDGVHHPSHFWGHMKQVAEKPHLITKRAKKAPQKTLTSQSEPDPTTLESDETL